MNKNKPTLLAILLLVAMTFALYSVFNYGMTIGFRNGFFEGRDWTTCQGVFSPAITSSSVCSIKFMCRNATSNDLWWNATYQKAEEFGFHE